MKFELMEFKSAILNARVAMAQARIMEMVTENDARRMAGQPAQYTELFVAFKDCKCDPDSVEILANATKVSKILEVQKEISW